MNNDDAITNLINMFKNNKNQDGQNSISPEAIENMIKTFKNSTNSNNTSNSNEQKKEASSNPFNIDMETLIKMKRLLDQVNKKDDPRSNLLLSLKPYLKDSRKQKVEQYIQLFNMSKVLDLFNKASGGDSFK